MASLIEEIITTLNSQNTHYEEILILAEEKSKIIKNQDIETLQKVTSAETAIIGKIQKLEIKREEIVKNIAIVLNQKYEELTISKIAEIINNEDDKANLLEVKSKLKQTLETLKKKNELNKGLLQSSLDYVDFSVNVIRNGNNDPLQDELPQELRKNLFDAWQ